MFQDRGGIGRVPCLLPCTWIDGWPMLGEYVGGDKLDKHSYKVPHDASAPKQDYSGIVGSDDFDGRSTLNGEKLYWQWNHNPVAEGWSLTERPGWMRLKTTRVVQNLFVAPNTLTQRMTDYCSGEICIDISKMKDGDRCGLAAFNGDSGILSIEQENGRRSIVLTEEHSVFKQPRDIDRVDVTVKEKILLKKNIKKIYLRVTGDFRHQKDVAMFAYSLDGKKWIDFNHEIKVPFDYSRFFMGTKFAIFNYATKQLGGYVDVDYFSLNIKP